MRTEDVPVGVSSEEEITRRLWVGHMRPALPRVEAEPEPPPDRMPWTARESVLVAVALACALIAAAIVLIGILPLLGV